jgi:ubiquitin carboxyl-terminal hydrolase 5/13
MPENEEDAGGPRMLNDAVEPDATIVDQLVQMGFSENGCRRAAIATRNEDLEVAMTWLLEHMDDANFSDPIIPSPDSSAVPPGASDETIRTMIDTICSMGYTSDQANAALHATDFNLERYASFFALQISL